MKYKIGDKVRVRSDLVLDHAYNGTCNFDSRMAAYRGGTYTIIDIGYYGRYKLAGIDQWVFSDDMLEPPTEPAELQLEVGKFYRTRDGRKAFVVGILLDNPVNPSKTFLPVRALLARPSSPTSLVRCFPVARHLNGRWDSTEKSDLDIVAKWTDESKNVATETKPKRMYLDGVWYNLTPETSEV